VSLHVERAGSGPDLVLLHGWGLHSGAWSESMRRLSASFRVHALDLPGHGLSATTHATSFDAAVDAVAEAMPHEAIVCGWSLGGLFAQRLASDYPERVRALALVGATPCFVAREGWPAAMKASTFGEFEADLATDMEATLARFVRLAALNGTEARAAIRLLSHQLAERGTPSAGGLACALGWLRDTDLRDDARRLAQPAVVIHGRHDALAPIDAGRWLAGALPAARMVELDDCAHLPFLTHRDAFVGALESLGG
jgi:pimeloyl-[acyl-carrier protein] methyl ester esterase